jgi:hypothetical protein
VEILPTPRRYLGKKPLFAWEKFFNLLQLQHFRELHKFLFKPRQTAMAPWIQGLEQGLSHKVFHRLCGDRGTPLKLLTA